MRIFSTSFLCVCAAVLVSAAGCTGGSTLDTVPVSGTVTMDGEPVSGATVTFKPEGDGHPAAGVTDASGNYTLTSEEQGDGAVVGTYVVTITKFAEEETSDFTQAQSMDEAYEMAMQAGEFEEQGRTAPEGPENELPEQYADPATSGLNAQVQDQDNVIDFQLES